MVEREACKSHFKTISWSVTHVDFFYYVKYNLPNKWSFWRGKVSGNTRELIKKSALVLFANNGYDATSIEKISSGAGIRKSSLYSFFASKEALFWAVYEDIEDKYYQHMECLLAESESMSPIDRLHYLFRQYLNCMETGAKQEAVIARNFWLRIMFFPPAELKERLLARALKRENELSEQYKQIIEEGIRQGLICEDSPDEILLSYYSLKQGLYSIMTVFMTEATDEQRLATIDKVWNNYYQGIKAK